MAFTARVAWDTNANMKGAKDTKLALGILAASRELGVEALLQKVGDAAAVGTDKTQKYLGNYTAEILKAKKAAEDAAAAAHKALIADTATREGVEKTAAEGLVPVYTDEQLEGLVGLAFTQSYKMEMAKINAKYPIAQDILSKYMTNFKVHSV